MDFSEVVLLDLFSGIGGFAKGFSDAGIKFKSHYNSEIDKFADAVYKYNFKNSINLRDVRTIKTLPEKPNIVTFGFPCQDLSIAGKRKGFKGKRSNLFYEAIRIVKDYLPEVFVFENVKGIFSSNEGKDFETVLREIAKIGLYECEWQLLDTAWFLPQDRERIYFVGHLRGKSVPGVFPVSGGDGVFVSQGRDGKAKSANSRTITKAASKGVINRGETYVFPVITPNRKVKRQNGRRFKNNGEPSFTLSTVDKHGVCIDDEIRVFTEIECERLQGFPDNWTQFGNYSGEIKKISKTQRYKQLGNAVSCVMPELIGSELLRINQ